MLAILESRNECLLSKSLVHSFAFTFFIRYYDICPYPRIALINFLIFLLISLANYYLIYFITLCNTIINT